MERESTSVLDEESDGVNSGLSSIIYSYNSFGYSEWIDLLQFTTPYHMAKDIHCLIRI